MANPIDNGFAKVLEYIVLAITVGCSLWMSVIAATTTRFTAG